MMSRRRIFASVASVAMASSACMAYPSNPWFQQAQSPAPQTVSASTDERACGLCQQAGGYQQEEGPRVSVYAEVDNASGSRLVRANFHLDDDAYVVVGHIDIDGVLRIAFPDTPLDNGFARGHASYQSAQFFAGFAGQYRARFATGLRSGGANTYDSYDGGAGYVFVIASWQPMHFEKFSTDGRWDSFELTDADYARNPRPAVNELASLLVGTNPSTYTVKFASVYDTRTPYSAADNLYDSFGAQTCSGFGFGYASGFPSSPFGFSAFNPTYTYGYGHSFWWRGSQYLYDAADDCYFNSGAFLPFGYRQPGYLYGWTVAQTPPPPPNNGRLIGIDRIRPPVTPQAAPMHLAPGGAADVGGSTTNASKLTLAPVTTPEYRTRGLVVHQDPAGSGEVIPRSFGGRAHDAGTQSSGFQGLVIRSNDNQSQNQNDAARRAPSTRGDAPTSGSPRVEAQSHNDAPRAAPQTRTETPRAESPRTAPAATSAPRAEAPRSEPARSAPAASSTSSSSSSGKPPSSKN
jgi:hypothetical protein